MTAALEDSVLSETEGQALGAYRDHFALSVDALNRDGAHNRFVKAIILKEVIEGKVPERVQVVGTLPFNLQKSEKLVYVLDRVRYCEPRTRTAYRGGYSGVSVRIAKGVYYRTGGFRGSPIVTSENVHIDTGVLAVTDKHLYFAGQSKTTRIRYDKIIAFTPYSDGVGIQRDASNAKPQMFITGDGWFVYNLITNLAHRTTD